MYNSLTMFFRKTIEPKKDKLLVSLLQVYYRRERGLHETEGETEQQEQVLTFSGNRTEGHLPGLQPYSVYNLSIRVLNKKGEGPPSLSKRFETPEGGVYHRHWPTQLFCWPF